ncbi:fasciclin domain-containing protein [Streptomyces sp. JJ38]|uniref:fasciclin domain-containing protein n=1 Tax=Streptomyces sp. JJ38 TaxID=2738128 RepID=UPI001C56044E|nr:fasciclin domain-containing protein [Streptomyces sp. JJ38]MBW1596021.1 fasciclin domain-containing protein [Streptomyces sp. JJ38]
MTTFHHVRRSAVAVVAAVVLPLALTACGSDGDTSDDSTAAASEQTNGANEESTEKSDSAGSEPFGPGCAAVPEDGAGSFEGMAKDPVATAASNNPALSTLVTAVQAADLVDTLNSAENITVFAPTNDAFAKIPEEDLNALLNDKEQLTKVLTYHVVGERLQPSDLENGTFKSLSEQELKTSGSGEEYEVNDASTVVCGNVQTANANVYIVDTVLMPGS